jgi:hypothetical protein
LSLLLFPSSLILLFFGYQLTDAVRPKDEEKEKGQSKAKEVEETPPEKEKEKNKPQQTGRR